MLGNKIQKTVGKEIQWSWWIPQLQIKRDEAESCIDFMRAAGERKSSSTQLTVILFYCAACPLPGDWVWSLHFQMTSTNVNTCCQWIVYLDKHFTGKNMQIPKSVRAQIFFNFIKAIFRIKEKHYLIYQLQGHGVWSLTLVHVLWRGKKMVYGNFNIEKVYKI